FVGGALVLFLAVLFGWIFRRRKK
ncbi:MAG: PEP-CTERM sorting domain-containing protein, partial [Candidatus Omnitrophica bacterium]|nr:PEP-CTERM sorting domain-containing protein [Candidatus Omnitrophota bacterium]